MALEGLVWAASFAFVAAPAAALLLDRFLGFPSHRFFALLAPPFLVATALLVATAGLAHPVVALVLLGAVGGLLGAVALDAVQLLGVPLRAFPVDPLTLPGVVSGRLVPHLYQNVIAGAVEAIAAEPFAVRRRLMARPVGLLGRLGERSREAVIAGMLRGVARLPEERREGMLATQLTLIAELAAMDRRAVMATLQRLLRGDGEGWHATEPYLLPPISVAAMRELAAAELPRTLREVGLSMGQLRLRGHLWHFAIGASLGAQYTLLFGAGSWGLALAWGVLAWAVKMLALPALLPMIRFPARFPVVLLLAHLAFGATLGWVALAYVPADAQAASLLGLLAR